MSADVALCSRSSEDNEPVADNVAAAQSDAALQVHYMFIDGFQMSHCRMFSYKAS